MLSTKIPRERFAEFMEHCETGIIAKPVCVDRGHKAFALVSVMTKLYSSVVAQMLNDTSAVPKEVRIMNTPRCWSQTWSDGLR